MRQYLSASGPCRIRSGFQFHVSVGEMLSIIRRVDSVVWKLEFEWQPHGRIVNVPGRWNRSIDCNWLIDGGFIDGIPDAVNGIVAPNEPAVVQFV